MSHAEIIESLKNFLRTDIMHDPSEDLDESTPLLEWGILDSLGMISLISFIEKTFKVKVPSEKVVPENFDNLRHIAQMITTVEATSAKKAA
jgi:acyl carrier protein